MTERADWEGRHIVIAEFTVPEEHHAELLAGAVVDAQSTLANEPGARQFDVNVPDEAPDMVILYEVYDDQAAFDAHLETPHLAAFREVVERCKAVPNVVHLTRVSA